MNDLAILILNYNTKMLTTDCIKSIVKSNDGYDIYLIDNASSDGTVEEIKKLFHKVIVIKNKNNYGFAKGYCEGLKKINKVYKYYLILNSDTVINNSLSKWIEVAEARGYDISGCKILNTDDSLQPSTGSLPNLLPVFFWISGLDDITRKVVKLPSYQERNVKFYLGSKKAGWVSGTAMLIRDNVIKNIGFLDEKIFMYGEDVEFCLRAKKHRFVTGWVSDVSIKHIGGASSDKAQYKQWLGELRGLEYIYKKHFGKFHNLILKVLIKVFIPIRAIAFYVVGKKDYARTYFQIYKEV